MIHAYEGKDINKNMIFIFIEIKNLMRTLVAET